MDAVNATENVVDYLHISFSWYDYTFFSIMLGLSALIGVYYGFIEKKQTTANEYLLGGKEMKVIPIAISLTASNISGITLLAVPTDVYRFGSNYWWYCLSLVGVYFVTYHMFIPIFYKLQVTSVYEYLKLRFNGKARILASFLYTICNILYLPIVIYVPALAFSQATGVNIHFVTPVVCGVCIFYTTIGGLKAVVWTDTLQFGVMVGSILGVCYMGISSIGGFRTLWNKSVEGKRIDFDMDLDPTKRESIPTIVIGMFFQCTSYAAISQGYVQKYLSMPTKTHIKQAIILFMIGTGLIITFSVLTGLIMYAKYVDCDPFDAGRIVKQDEILPYYVMDVSRSIPGLAGLFMSGIFSAGLSTLSATMNCLSGSIYEDFVSPFMQKNISQKRVSDILKLIVVIIGIISTVLVFMIEKMGNILPVQFSLSGITGGPLLGLFLLGAAFPAANSKGALTGGLCSLAYMTFMVTGSQLAKANGSFTYPSKPFSTEGCNTTIAVANITEMIIDEPQNVLYFFRITHYYYTCVGTLLVILIGLPVSWMSTKADDPLVDRDLISPISQWLIREEKDKGKYLSVKKAFNVVMYPNKEEKLLCENDEAVRKRIQKNISQKRVSDILKLIVVIIGIISTVLVFMIEKMGNILPVQFSLSGITGGPLLGLYLLGAAFPAANSKGALTGGLCSLAYMTFMVTGSQLAKANGSFTYPSKPFSTEGCNTTIAVANITEMIIDEPQNVLYFFRITHYYYTCVGTLLVILIGLPVSWMSTKADDPLVDRDLISPISQWLIREEKDKGKYLSVKKAFNVVMYPNKEEKC